MPANVGDLNLSFRRPAALAQALQVLPCDLSPSPDGKHVGSKIQACVPRCWYLSLHRRLFTKVAMLTSSRTIGPSAYFATVGKCFQGLY